MPQLFQVLKCFKCLFFQVHQTKKSNKWECKLCGEKQSIKRHYGVGIAKDCRLQVQKLNEIRGEADNSNEISKLNRSSDENDPEKDATLSDRIQPLASKWSEFVEKTEDILDSAENETMYLGNAEVVLEAPKKKRKFYHPKAFNKINKSMVNPCSSKTDDGKPLMGSDSLNTKEFNLNKTEDYNESDINKVVFCSVPLNVRKHTFCTQKEIFDENSKNDEYSVNTQQEPVNSRKENFLFHKFTKDSKWAQFADESDEVNDSLTDESKMKKADFGYNIFPLCSKEQSETADSENNDNIIKLECSQRNDKPHIRNDIPHNMFSLCDENDLDDVLDI